LFLSVRPGASLRAAITSITSEKLVMYEGFADSEVWLMGEGKLRKFGEMDCRSLLMACRPEASLGDAISGFE
jgi:hypothetical protein